MGAVLAKDSELKETKFEVVGIIGENIKVVKRVLV